MSTAPTVLNQWEGVDARDGVLPPDTEGDVGPNDYVQWVNLSFEIWSKTGTVRYGPAEGNTLWSGFGGPCATGNQGDPQVVYDRIANRWVFMQFAWSNINSGPFYLCMAVSQTSDPTGSYFRYAFHVNTTNNDFPDYPKLGVWPDGYYVTTNNFAGNPYDAPAVFAFDRTKMLAGDPSASFIEYQIGSQYYSLLPANFTGSSLPPAGEPEYFGAVDTSSTTGHTFQLWQFHADFATPSNSSFTGPTNLTVSSYGVNGSSGIPQPGTTQKLDPLDDRLLQRLQYRNFGDHEGLIASHTVDVSSTATGVRWYELRITPSGGTPLSSHASVYQQGTYEPADGVYRWMGSAAMDSSGDIALGYSMSSSTVHPSIGVTGRLVGDTLGQMTLGETTMIAGGGSQTSSSDRWGDYSAMVVDPTDDQTFWYTQEYYATTSSASWATRIGYFRLAQAANASLNEVNAVPVAFPASTNQTVTSIAGGCTPGSGDVTPSVDGVAAASVTCSPSGTWTATESLSAEGTYTLSATQGTAGTANLSLTIDKTAPAVSLTQVNATPASFPYSTNQTVTSIGGACGTTAGDIATVRWSVSGTASANGSAACSSGAWSATVSLASAGTYTLAATQADQAGNTGSTGNRTLTIDKTAPTVTLTNVNAGAVTFPYSTNQNVTSFGGACGTASGDSATVGWSVTGTVTTSGMASCTSGTWSATVSLTAEGSYTLSATQSDQAGNIGSTGTKSVTIDKTAPAVTLTKVNGSTVTFPYYTNANVTSIGGACGSASGDSTTVSWSVSGPTTESGTVTCSSGAWTKTLTTTLSSAGSYTLSATQSDAAGNTGSSGNQSLTIDKTAPTTALTFPAASGSYDATSWNAGCSTSGICGTASDSGSGVEQVLVSIQQGSGNYWNGTSFSSSSEQRLTATGTTSWGLAFDASKFPAGGSYTVRAYGVDNAGNTSTATTATFTFSTGPLPTVSLTKVNGTTVTFPYSTNQDVTSIGGGCTTGDGNVTPSVNGVTGTSVSCSVSGTWTATESLSSEATYTLSASQTDISGTGSSGNQSLVIDKTAPVVSVTKVNGSAVSFPYSTNSNVTSIGGACGTVAGDGSSVSWSVSGASSSSGTATCLSGAWSASVSLSSEGTYTLSATQSDAAGNTGSSGSQSLVIDKTAPVVSLTKVNGSTVTFPYSTSSNVTSFGGACGTAPGDSSSVSWSVTGAATSSGSAPCSSGSWSATVSLSSEGNYTLAATQGDQAGNTGSSGQSLTITAAGTGSSGNQSLIIADLAPIASFTFSPTAPLPGEAVTFNGSGSHDPDGSIASYAWMFGDGSAGATGVTVSHSYLKPGTYTVQLTVTDNSGSVGMTAQSVTVSPAPVVHPPRVTLRIPKQRLGAVLAHGLLVRMSSNQSGSAKLTLMLSPAAAKAAGLGNGKRAVTIGSVTRRLTAGQTVGITLKLTKPARRRLAKAGRVRVTFKFAVTGTGGKTTGSQRLLIKR